MKRLHVNLAVDDIEESIRFYSVLFAAEPVVVKPDYAKWMLEDPRVNFAIANRAARKGVDHLGIQVEDADELREVYVRLKDADRPTHEVGKGVCCYAQSEKTWITDPQGVAWEAFLTTGDSAVYGEDVDVQAATGTNCCPTTAESDQASACC